MAAGDDAVPGQETAMSSIESSPYPLAFRLPQAPARLELRTRARALAGMQKEAVVSCTPGGQQWRMVCDEGPYLNGTDLAPFPLAYFSTGLVNAFMAEILALARERGLRVTALQVTGDSRYTMQGSAVRGDMLGGALPVELAVDITLQQSDADTRILVTQAAQRSPVQALLSGEHVSRFALQLNGQPVKVDGVLPWENPEAVYMSDDWFDDLRPDGSPDVPDDLIAKLPGSASVFHGAGGAGSSLAAEQKRTLHVRAIATLREDGLSDTQVQLFKPTGSNFRFLCDVMHALSGGERAPAPLVYISAGIAFCFLTQIGRYVTILKVPLDRFAIAQVTAFGSDGEDGHADGDNDGDGDGDGDGDDDNGGGQPASPTASPVLTFVELETPADEAAARRIVVMGERTCFLHAAARTPLKTRVRVADGRDGL
jgi:uncharacterized OsmC-like protein